MSSGGQVHLLLSRGRVKQMTDYACAEHGRKSVLFWQCAGQKKATHPAGLHQKPNGSYESSIESVGQVVKLRSVENVNPECCKSCCSRMG